MIRFNRVFRIIHEFGAEAFKPQLLNGHWLSPLISNRQIKEVRRHAILNGLVGNFDRWKGGWLVEWDKPREMHSLRPMKGNKSERTRPQRAEKITKAMESMPAAIEKYKNENRDRRPRMKGIVDLTKKIMSTERASRRKRTGGK